MLQVYLSGHTSGTWKNKLVQVNRYLQFFKKYQADPMSPSPYDLLLYLLHLSESLASPGAVMNYFSGGKTWVQLLGGNEQAFDSHHVSMMKRGVQQVSNHTH